MDMQAADFSELFGCEKFSDVNVLLHEEEVQDGSSSPQQAGKRPRGAEELLPCHKLVLRALSQYFKAKIDDWSEQQPPAECLADRSSKAARTSRQQDAAAAAAAAAQQQQQQPGKPQIELPVPIGQLPVGRLLLKCMYAAQPDLSAVSQTQLVQLIVLADRYQVPKAVAAVAAAVKKLPTANLEWETVFSVYRSVAGWVATEPFMDFHAAAVLKVQMELHDLEYAWEYATQEELLVQLPFALLQQLLSNPNTSVASEDTVLYTLERWCAWQQQHMPPAEQATDEQLRDLVGLVRMSHCSKAYVATVFAAGTVAARALQSSELAQAVLIAGKGDAPSTDCPCTWPVLQTFSWIGYRRNLSLLDQACTVRFSAEQLASLYHDIEAGAAAAADYPDGSYRAFLYHDREICYQGVRIAVGVGLQSSQVPQWSNAYGPDGVITHRTLISLCLCVKMVGMPAGAVLPRPYTIRSSATWRPRPHAHADKFSIDASAPCIDGAYITGWFQCPAEGLDGFKRWLQTECWAEQNGSMCLYCTQSYDEGQPGDFDPEHVVEYGSD